MERRVFNTLPEYHRTDHNRRETYIADDVLFEPEKSAFVNGYIGDTSIVTAEDLKRTPPVDESDPVRRKYQLSVGMVHVDPDTIEYKYGAFYTDLINTIGANGGITDDPNRLFGTTAYAWTPPINYDLFLNPGRYVWTGIGDADVTGEYITQEPKGSQTCLYQLSEDGFDRVPIEIVAALPVSGTLNQLVEHGGVPERTIYRWNGTTWVVISFKTVPDVPTDTTGLTEGDYVYVARTGPEHNRPLVFAYHVNAGRWVAIPAVVSPEFPDTPRLGMIWEDSSLPPIRILRRWNGVTWEPLTTTAAAGPSGTPSVDTFIYDVRNLSEITNGWSANNWWRAFEDLSSADRAALSENSQGIRPIIEFWGGLEPTNTRTARHTLPRFRIFTSDANGVINQSTATSTVFQYRVGTGDDDPVLTFPPVMTELGEFQFDLTLEKDTISGLLGYRYVKDSTTNYVHSIWAKATLPYTQTPDSNGLFDLPKNLTSNPDHGVLTDPSRSKVIVHMLSVLRAQAGFEGDPLGANNYRFTERDTTRGATIVDHEGSLLRPVAVLQTRAMDIPDAIRFVGREYNRFINRFITKLNQRWELGDFSDPTDSLIVTATEAVDAVLTDIFIGQSDDFPFFNSEMGTFMETRVSLGVATVIDQAARPIFLPNSPPRIGASPVFAPGKFTDSDGVSKLIGHDGSIRPSFGDERDLVLLNLENRFFVAVPDRYKVETNTVTSRYDIANFALGDYYGNFTPSATVMPVDAIVADYRLIVGPAANLRVFSIVDAGFAVFDGERWFTEPALQDDIFLNQQDNKFYIFNGFFCRLIKTHNRPLASDYSTNEYHRIIRREFERFVAGVDGDFVTNTTFDKDDRFTWNYSSAGIEGNYRGIYRRLYGTIAPHMFPWQIAGYSVEPSWWRTVYVPTSTAADGTPRYARTHQMWVDLQAGLVHQPLGLVRSSKAMVAPIPVNNTGALLDPIAAGILDETDLDIERIDDDWVYGDGAPIEQTFYESSFYPAAVALAGYLMKPAIFVDRVWGDSWISIGDAGANQVWRAPHCVLNRTLTRPAVSTASTHLTQDASGAVIKSAGLNSWIAERINSTGGSPNLDFARIVNNTIPALAWKTAGFINRNRTVIETLSGKDVPFEDIHVVLHQAPVTQEKFQSGITIVRESTGYRVFGFDAFRPFFTVDAAAVPVVGGQVELREEFTATANQHDFVTTKFPVPQSASDTARFGVILNGYRLKDQHFFATGRNSFSIDPAVLVRAGDVVVAVVITAQSSPSTATHSFTISGVQFNYFASGTGNLVNYNYGHFFGTAGDVINFMVGHGRWLTSQGWVFEQTANGDFIDWLAGAKQFAQFALDTGRKALLSSAVADGSVFRFTAMGKKAVFKSPFGHVLGPENTRNGVYGIINQDGRPIRPDRTVSNRDEDTLAVEAINTTDLIYGSRIYLTEIQHAVFFANQTKFNDLIYDPVLALFHPTLRVDTYRSLEWNGRLEAPGNIIRGPDLLPNFEKQAFDLTRLYDRSNPVDSPTLRDQARNLYGYEPDKSYMLDIDADDRMQFDFYRGLINAKGTARAYKAFARGTRIGQDGMRATEDWAWKLSILGDIRGERVQFEVKKNDFQQQLQVIRFEQPPEGATDNIFISRFDRSSPNHDRWIIPPRQSAFTPSNFVFPVSGSLPDVGVYTYACQLIDVDRNRPILYHFNWDPALDLHEPSALGQIDCKSVYDPARYNTGPLATTTGALWGPEQVGQLWWDTGRTIYSDYRAALPQYTRVAHEWGRLKYFKATISRTNEVVTVTTLDPLTGATANHGLATGQLVTIRGADQIDYNVTELAVTVASASTFTWVIDNEPDTPATGPIEVIVGAIPVYEWVESSVTPDQWDEFVAAQTGPDAYTGTALNGSGGASYVTVTSIDEFGNTVTRYYFWVRGNKRANPSKDYVTADIEGRLVDPLAYGLPFFAVIDSKNMLIYTDGEKVEDGYGIDLSYSRRVLLEHVEWVLLSEGEVFNPVPAVITEKLVDSLCGKDRFENVVPSQLLSDAEKYGNDFFPAQSIFRDRTTALDVWLTALNAILRLHELEPLVDKLIPFLDLADETGSNSNGFWTRETYVNSSIAEKAILETVADYAERDFRLGQRMYVVGDIVRVKKSDQEDLWAGTQVSAIYEYQGSGVWFERGVEAHTVKFNTHVIDNTTTFRRLIDVLSRTLTAAEWNSLTFSMMHEMLRQNPLCDWFMKTSYLTVHVTDLFDTAPYLRPKTYDTIFAAIRDTKPFRTKLRNEIVTLKTPIEDVALDLTEKAVTRTVFVFDRLSCNLLDDHTWDTDPWDRVEWDLPIWDYEDLGRAKFRLVGSIICTSVDLSYFIVVNDHDPRLYATKVEVWRNGTLFDPTSVGLTIEILKTHKRINLRINQLLNNQYELKVYLSYGFYEGKDPSMGAAIAAEYPDLQATPSDYKHATARLMPFGIPSQTSMVGCEGDLCEDPLGGDPEERMVFDVTDSFSMVVTNDHTPAFAGWDASPWDTTGWDEGVVTDVGERKMIVLGAEEEPTPPGVVLYSTNEDLHLGSDSYLFASNPDGEIGAVYFDQGAGFVLKTKGVHWDHVSGLKNVIEVLTPPEQTFGSNGAQITFNATAAENGVDRVYRSGVLMTEFTDYTVNDTLVTFVQPPPTIVEQLGVTNGVSYQTDGTTDIFSPNLPTGTVVASNVFPFINGVLQHTYSITGDLVDFVTPPAAAQTVALWGIGNDYGEAESFVNISVFTADGVQTAFSVVGVDIIRAFVFVNGVYQVLGTHYTISTASVNFVAPPTNGSRVEIRVLDATTSGQHLVITTGGGANENLPDINAPDINELMVFVDGALSDGYSLGTYAYTVSGSPAVLSWMGTPPAAASKLSVRWIRKAVVRTDAIFNVIPHAGETIRVVANPYISPGSPVRLIYNAFDLHVADGYQVISTGMPDYDIIGRRFAFTQIPTPGVFFSIVFSNPRRTRNLTAELVHLRLADDLLADHEQYDSPLGFEINRKVGLIVVDTGDLHYWQWDGTAWIDNGAVQNGHRIIILRRQAVYEMTGGNLNLLYEVGGSLSSPPLLGSPAFGQGVSYSTYQLGSNALASTQWPDAYQIMQHSG